MYELWIKDGARVERVTTAADKGTLRRMWRVHRDAALVLRGEVLEFKTGCSDGGSKAIATAARQAFRAAPPQPAPPPAPAAVEEPEDDLEAAEPDADEPDADAESLTDGALAAAAAPEPVEPEVAAAGEPEPASSPLAPATCIRPGCDRPTRGARRGTTDPALVPLCESCKATAYRLMRLHGITAAAAGEAMSTTPRGRLPLLPAAIPSRAKLAVAPRSKPAAKATPCPAPAPVVAPAPAAPTPAGDLPALLAEAGEALRLCRAYGGVDMVRKVLEQLAAWREAAA